MDDHTRKMHLVAERYWELQGLRGALVGTGLMLGAGAAILLPTFSPGVDAEIWSLPLAAGLAFLVILPGMLWLDRFYARTFGRLKPSAKARRFGLLIVPALLIPGMVAGPHFGSRGYVAFFIGWAVVGLWITTRDWPFRTHHLLDVVAGIFGALVLWKLSAEQPESLGLLWGFLVIGTAATITGLLDHQLLARTLGGGGGRAEAQPGEIKV
jgi:hypothetical protein